MQLTDEELNKCREAGNKIRKEKEVKHWHLEVVDLRKRVKALEEKLECKGCLV